MIPVSTKWKEAIREQFRYQGYLSVTLQVTPPGLMEGLTIDTASTDDNSVKESLVDEYPGTVTPYATLEHGRWKLDGSYDLLSRDTVTQDWWSTPLVDSGKELIFTFDKAYSIPGIYIEWDVVNHTYPANVVITGYDNSGFETYSFTITDIISATGFIEIPMDNVRKVVVLIKEWSKPRWRVRINEILFGLYAKYDSINNGRVMSAKSVDSTSPLGKTLPVHTFSVSLRNTDMEFDPSLQTGMSKYLATRQLIKYRWGFTTSYGQVEWTPSLVYFMDSFSIPKDQRNVQLIASSRLAFLTNKVGDVPYDASERTFYDIADSVLRNSNVLKVTNETPWVLSETLKNFHTNAPLPNLAVNVVLQYLSSASGVPLWINPVNGYIMLSEFVDSEQHIVDFTSSQGDPAVEIQDTLRSISIGVSTYTLNNSEKVQIAKVSQKYSGDNVITVNYTEDYAVNVTCSITGATLVEFSPYSTYARVRFTAPESDTEVTVVLNGNVVTRNDAVIESYRNINIDVGLDVSIENPFITNTERLDELTGVLVDWYTKPNQLKVPYLGYPELATGDSVDLSTIYGDSVSTVLNNTIDFNGGFNGTVQLR